MSTKNITKATLARRVRDLVAGTVKRSPGGPFTLDGKEFTAQSLIHALQGLENAIAKVDMAKAGWKDALKTLVDEKAKVDPLVAAYRSWIVATHGNAPAVLAEFGLEPPKARTPLTADQKAIAVAKRAATRAARHTTGPKKKALIKGDVNVAVITTPAVAPAKD